MVGGRPAVRRALAPVLLIGWAALIGCAALSGCTAPSGSPAPNAGPTPSASTDPTASAAPIASAAPTASTAPSASTAVQQQIEQAIDAVNATAGGPVQAQQAALARLVSAGQAAQQNQCPAATNTIAFDPVYARLAPSPGWRPGGGTLPGAVYALPTLIRIYTGDRITGRDLTDLHLAIDGGRAQLPAICTP